MADQFTALTATGTASFLGTIGGVLTQLPQLSVRGESASVMRLQQTWITAPTTGFRVILVTRDGTGIAELDQATSGSVSWELNGRGAFEFSLPLEDPKNALITVSATELQCWWRGRMVWWGVITRLQEEDGVFTYQALDCIWYFTRRIFGRVPLSPFLVNGSFTNGATGWDCKVLSGSNPSTLPTLERTTSDDSLTGDVLLQDGTVRPGSGLKMISPPSGYTATSKTFADSIWTSATSSTFTTAGGKGVDTFSKGLKDTQTLVIEGHLDSTTQGTHPALALARADALKTRINAKKPAVAITTVSKGSTTPVKNNKTAANRKANRRCIVRISTPTKITKYTPVLEQQFTLVPEAYPRPRKNLAKNPRMISSGTTQHAARWSGTLSYLTTVGDHPVKLTTAARLTATAATQSAGAITGFGLDFGGNMDAANPSGTTFPISSGKPYTVSGWVRSSVAVDVRAQIRFFAGSTWSAVATNSVAVSASVGEWKRVTVTATAPAGATHVCFRFVSATSRTWNTGNTFDTTGVLLEQSDIMGLYFDGSEKATVEWGYKWDDDTNKSISIASPKTKIDIAFVGWLRIVSWAGNNADKKAMQISFAKSSAPTKVVQTKYFSISEKTPRETWIRIGSTLNVPADGLNYIVTVRLYGIIGSVIWDEVSMNRVEDLKFRDVDQGLILKTLVEWSQDPANGKESFGIGVNAPTTGVLRTREYIARDRENVYDAVTEFGDLGDGMDIGMVYTDSTRTLTGFYPRRGGAYKDAVKVAPVLSLGGNLETFGNTWEGEDAANQIVIQAEGDDVSADEGYATDTSYLGVLLEKTYTATPNSSPSSLQAQAWRAWRRHSRANNLPTVTTKPEYADQLFDTVQPGTLVRVYAARGPHVVDAHYRVNTVSLDPSTEKFTYELSEEFV